MIKNNSSQGVYFGLSDDYPDTLDFDLSSCPKLDDRYVPPGESKVFLRNGPWKALIDRLPYGKLMFFIYSADSINKYYEAGGCENVLLQAKDTHQVLKRFDVSADDLERSNYKITFD